MSERKIKISFIIPLYNAESYLSDLFQSLDNQSDERFEVIFINDGSTDKTFDKVSDFCNINRDRYKLFNIKNSGVSFARHFGYSQASGEYVFFIDSDDYISSETVELLLLSVEEFNSDIVIVDYVKFDTNKKKYINALNSTSDQYSVELILNKQVSYSIWGKLFKKEILKDYMFRHTYEFSIGEDLLFNLSLSNERLKMSHIMKGLYYYRLRKSSLSSSKFITLEYFIKFRRKYESIIPDMEGNKTVIDDSRYGVVDIIGLPLFYNYGEFLKITTFMIENQPPKEYINKLSKIKKIFILCVINKYIPKVFIYLIYRYIYRLLDVIVSRRFYI
ncbi:glycosyltransferase family 2 protein [Photobacterium damselae]